MKIRTTSVVLLLVLLLSIPGQLIVACTPESLALRSERVTTVMTRNLYFGANLTPIFEADSALGFIAAVTTVYQEAEASDIPGRMETIADEIAASEPLLVGMQEVATFATSPLDDPTNVTVTYDFLELLLADLADRGLAYEPVVAVTGLDAQAPTGLGFIVQLTIRDVLLARADAESSELTLSNPQGANYSNNLEVDTPVGPIMFPRQWASVDAKIRGKSFRFITTHLEAFSAEYRVAQVGELLAGPANTELPTIVVGDLNSKPEDVGDGANLLIQSGFVDMWHAANPDDPGFTCCQSGDLRNEESQLIGRIDLILARGDFDALNLELVGNEITDKTPSGLWPSDHAGVMGSLVLPEP